MKLVYFLRQLFSCCWFIFLGSYSVRVFGSSVVVTLYSKGDIPFLLLYFLNQLFVVVCLFFEVVIQLLLVFFLNQ